MRKAFGDDVAQSLLKVKLILRDEVFQVIKDVATVEAARAQKAATGAAVVGLVGGSIVSSMLRHMADLKIGTSTDWLVPGARGFVPGTGVPAVANVGPKGPGSRQTSGRASGGTAAKYQRC